MRFFVFSMLFLLFKLNEIIHLFPVVLHCLQAAFVGFPALFFGLEYIESGTLPPLLIMADTLVYLPQFQVKASRVNRKKSVL